MERTAAFPRTAGNENTNLLKWIALFFMILDHTGAIFFSRIPFFRLVGRIAFPLYAWCMAVGSEYTRDKGKYALRLLLGGLVSQVLGLGNQNAFLGRLDIGHENTSSAYRTHGTCKYRYFTTMQKKNIQNSPGKIKRKFIFFQKNLNFAGIGPRRAGKTDSHALQIQKYHPLCFELRD